MKKVIALVLMLFTVLSGAWCYAHGITGTENKKDGIPIEIKKDTPVSTPDKSSSIQASIDGHTLTVVFLENLGQVQIQVETALGGDTQYQSTPTPNGVIFYITNTGSYIVTFTLPNGDEYYGEFEVTD